MSKCSLSLFLTQFADDSTLTYTSSESLEHARKTIEKEFKKVLIWLAANKLIINLNKTHLMVFTNSHRAEPDKSITISANDQTISEITETKFLGVILDNKLCWDAHIKHISNKMSKSVAILKILKHTFPTSALKTIYHSLIYPYLNYCNLIWGSAASTHLESLTLIQKKCIRNICKVGTMTTQNHYSMNRRYSQSLKYTITIVPNSYSNVTIITPTLISRVNLKKTVTSTIMIQEIKTHYGYHL